MERGNLSRYFLIKENKMSKVVSNKRQLRRLVELLQQNRNIARGISSKTTSQKKWEEFTEELNFLGPPQREWHKWQRVWADLKCKIKKKKTENDFEERTNGRNQNPIRIHHFSDMEEAVINMLDLNKETFQLQPEPEPNSQPKQEVSRCEDSIMSVNESLISLEDIKFDPEEFNRNLTRNNHQPSKDSKEASSEKEYPNGISIVEQSSQTDECHTNTVVIENQKNAQQKFYENMTDLMRDIKRSINNIEDHIKKDVQQKDELLELKREKLKVYKEKMKSQRVDRKAKLKLKAELVKLKRQKQNATGS